NAEESEWRDRVRHGSRSALGIVVGRVTRRSHPRRQLLRLFSRTSIRVAQIGLQGVIADVEDAARPPLVSPAPFEDQPRVAAAPPPERFVPRECRAKRLLVFTA